MARSSEQICFDDIIHKQANQRSSCVTFVSIQFFYINFFAVGLDGSGGGESWEQQLRKAAQESI